MTDPKQAPVSLEEMAHAFEEEAGPVDLSPYALEDWATFALFWGMALCVFLQFFTRYALNDSFTWTEEIAANLLVMVVFLGSVLCLRLRRHIAVDLIFRLIPPRAARWLGVFVDLVVAGFLGYMTWLIWRYVSIVGGERMVTVNFPRGVVYYTVFAAFVLMFLRAVQNLGKDLIFGTSGPSDPGGPASEGR